MAYSGTVGQTTITVQNLIDDGARRSGKLAEELTVEQVQSAKRALFYVLSNLINQGIQYFAIKKTVIGLLPEQFEYLLPVGGNDVLNALYRTMARPSGTYTSSAGGVAENAFDGDIDTYCQQTSTGGEISVDYGYGQANYVGSIGFMPYIVSNGSATWSYLLESSEDGITWKTLYTGTAVTVTDKRWIWEDIDPGSNARFFRMSSAGTTVLSLRELYFGTSSNEITMARLNRDDYTNLPNKNFLANNPYQFWLNRTIPQATITLWPTPSDAFVQMVVWYSAQIEDVGALSGQLAIPDRWLMAIQNMLAHQMAQILPNVDAARIGYLEGQAEKYFNMAEQEERDKSPIYLAPNIGVYTR